MGGVGILIVMAVLGAFWQLFVVCGMHMPVILLAQVQIIAAGYDPFVFVSTNCAMAAVWGCAFGAFLKMKNPDEKGLAPVSYTHLDVYKRQTLAPWVVGRGSTSLSLVK